MKRRTLMAKSLPKTESPTNESAKNFDSFSADVATFSIGAAKGAVPLYGAYENLSTGLTSAIFNPSLSSGVAFAGSLINLAGTVSLGVGLIGGNSTAAIAGGALLLASGVTNGQAYL